MRALNEPPAFRAQATQQPDALTWRAFDARPTSPVQRVFRQKRNSSPRAHALPQELPSAAFYVLLIALVTRIIMSTGLLYMLHINYGQEGGNPLTKIHPGTYLMGFAMWLWLADGGEPLRKLVRHYHQQRALFAFTGLMAVCIIYAVVNRLGGYLSVFADTFISAGILASLLSAASVRQRAAMGQVLIWTLCINAAVAIGETVVQRPLIAEAPTDGLVTISRPGEFRGSAFSSASLEGAIVTMMGLFLLLRLRLPPRAMVWRFSVLMLGLISFGGRTEVVVTSIVLILTGIGYMLREISARRMRAETIGMSLIAAVVLPMIVTVIITFTPLGQRIYNSFYLDDSAQTRGLAWHIFSVLPATNFVLGTPVDLTTSLAKQIGIPIPYADLENCWLVLLVSLGLIGFTIFMFGFIPFLVHLWNRAGQARKWPAAESTFWGRVILVSFLVVASSNNSFGRKGPLLVVLTAAIYAAAFSGQTYRRPPPRRAGVVRGRPALPPSPYPDGPYGPRGIRGRTPFQKPGPMPGRAAGTLADPPPMKGIVR